MNTVLFDSHCHLQDEDFASDREAVYERARTQGIGLLVPGYTMDSSRRAIRFAEEHEASYALVGVHPHDAKTFRPEDLSELESMIKHPMVVGIGEVGLDYHYQHSAPDVQKNVFREQLTLAREAGLPVAVHTREAEDDTLKILDEVGHRKGVIHCFTGTGAFAEAILDRGWYISFSGAITFKSAHSLRDVVRHVPLEKMLVETDSPYLSPVPWRGQRNEPMRVIRVAEVVAAQKECLTKEVFAASLSNTKRLFSLRQNIG